MTALTLDVSTLQQLIRDGLGCDFTVETCGLAGRLIRIINNCNHVDISIDTQIYYLEIRILMHNPLVDLDVDIRISRNASGSELALSRLMNCNSDVLDPQHLHDLIDYYFEKLPEQTYEDLNSLAIQICEFVSGFINSH